MIRIGVVGTDVGVGTSVVAAALAALLRERDVEVSELAARDGEPEADGDVVVDGGGGLLLPLARGMAFDGLCVAWELDLVVVTADRPGALNHTLLTVRAAHDAGLRVRGVVLDAPSPDRPGDAVDRETLAELLAPVPLLELPYLEDPADPERLAAAAREHGLEALVRERVRG